MKPEPTRRLGLSETVTSRRYCFTQRQLKKALGIKGDIKEIGLWAGTAPKDEGRTSPDEETWSIQTEERGDIR